MKNLIIYILVIILYSNTVYAASSAGQKEITEPVTITAEASWNITLTLNNSSSVTKIRVYSSSSSYKDYTSYSYIPVYPGQKVIIYKNNSGYWYVFRQEGESYSTIGSGTNYTFTVPTNASDNTYLYVVRRDAGVATNGTSFYMHYSGGWIKSVI